MTRGQEALAEAMRLEQARIYSETVEQHRGRVGGGHYPALLADEFDELVDGRRAVMNPNVIPIRGRGAAA